MPSWWRRCWGEGSGGVHGAHRVLGPVQEERVDMDMSADDGIANIVDDALKRIDKKGKQGIAKIAGTLHKDLMSMERTHLY